MEESPERTIPAVSAHSPIVQDSPFFRYLDNLSPIKPVKSVHVAQTFSELNFPPPPAVFTSPRVSCQKEANFLKRSCQDDMGGKQSNAVEHESDRVKSSCNGTTPVVDKEEEPKSRYQDSDKSNVENKSTHLPVGYFVDLSSDQRDRSKVSSETISSVELPALKETTEYACDSIRNNDKFSEPNAIEEFTDPQNDISEMDTSESMEDKSLQVVDGGGETTSSKSGCDELTVPLSTLDLDNKDSVQATDNTQNFQASSNNAESFAEHDNGSFTFLLSKDSGCTTGVWHKVPSAECSSDMFEQGFKDVPSNCEMNCEQSDVDCTPQPLHDSFLSSEISDELNIKIDNPQTRPTEHHISLICKPLCQPHRGMRRRCLDFEATEAQKKIVNSSLKQMKTNTASESFSKAPDAVSSLSFSQVREEVADGKQHLLNKNSLLDKDGKSLPSLTMRFSNCFSKATDPISEKPEKSVKNSVTPQMSGGMPSGIGLHLNSLATTMPTSCNANVLSSAKVPVSMQAVMPFKGVKEGCPDITDGSYSSINQDGNALPGSNTKSGSCMALSVLENPRADQHELMSSGMRKTGLKKTASSSQSLAVTLKPLQTNAPSKFEERNESPLDKKRSTQPEKNQQSLFNSCDELSQGSPKKKRRKSSSSTDKEGCKRCNCKKSKCLKLYCECFAAGVYCVEPCTCLECFNKPEYEDMVLGTRQQIESRNPLAFAPKIVRNSDSPPIIGDECGETPASARHKRGCNCKKSMCLKKYCECYQAGVGCSDGCRCESCKNIYGKKDAGLSESENRAALDETTEMDSSEDKMVFLESEVDNVHVEQQQVNDISPITPSLHCISQGRSMAKLKSGCKRHISSEELDSSTLSQSSARPPKSPAKFARSMKVHHGDGTCSSQSHFGSRKFATSILTTHMDKSGQISQNWDGQTNMCTMTPILQPPMRPAVSVSNADGTASSPFSGPKSEISGSNIRQLATRHTCHGGSPPVFHHQISCSPLCCSETNHWQSPLSVNGTPLTPSHSSTACNGTTKNPENSDYDIHSHNASVSAEDDTPDILKNSCSPTRGLKANSPNQKRVSPPHNCYGKEKSRGFVSSPGLKSGRKFILQSLSSFPLTTLTCEDHIKD